MSAEFIIGLDSSTQSTKAIAWDKNGNALGEGRAPIPMNAYEVYREQSVEDWWQACLDALSDLGKSVDFSQAKGIAISNQRETVGYIDAQGKSVRPAMVWLDERAVPMIKPFSEQFGAERLHKISGKPIDTTPVVYRLAWMRQHEPEHLDKTAKIVDVQSFLIGRLTGHFVGSWTSADPFGIFDIEAKAWSQEIITALDMRLDQCVDVVAPGGIAGHLSQEAAALTGLPESLPVIAAGGDGQCAGLGVDAVRPGVVYLNLGTALITGAWSPNPEIGLDWRTMTSPTGVGYFLEGCLRAGTYLIDWFIENFVDAERKPETFRALEKEAMQLPIGSDGVIASPYLSGSMNPHWKADARAAFIGMHGSHGKAHLYRALLEALTGEVARTTRAMQDKGLNIDQIIAVGGGANSQLWCEMIADACGLTLKTSKSLEASSLGAAISAAKGLGWYDSFDAASKAMCSTELKQMPNPDHKEAWQNLLKAQSALNSYIVAL